MSNSLEILKIKHDSANYLKGAGGLATWVQQMKFLEDRGYETWGEVAVCYEKNTNINYWFTSASCATAITEGIDEGLFKLEVISPALYLVYGVVPDLSILSSRRLGFLLRDWAKGGSAAWIDKPVWVPTLILLGDISTEDLMAKEITPEMLKLALDYTDAGAIWLEQFGRLVSRGIGEAFDGDGEGIGGKEW